jgi:hypothetical protein
LVAKGYGGHSPDQPSPQVVVHAETFTSFNTFLDQGSRTFCMEPLLAGWGLAPALPLLQHHRML